jgi:hypothetical protein
MRRRSRIPGRAVVFLAALLACQQADAFDYDGRSVFVVDRCGGDYGCEDAKLILIDTQASSAKIYSGVQDTRYSAADGSPSHADGYTFKGEKSRITVEAAPPAIVIDDSSRSLSGTNGIVLETDDYYLVFDNMDCGGCGKLSEMDMQAETHTGEVFVISKTDLSVRHQQVELNSECVECTVGDDNVVIHCSSKHSFELGNESFVISGELCFDKATLSIVKDGEKTYDKFVLERPAAL